jgi:hypothetical protein
MNALRAQRNERASIGLNLLLAWSGVKEITHASLSE